jgi:hypothetical protein
VFVSVPAGEDDARDQAGKGEREVRGGTGQDQENNADSGVHGVVCRMYSHTLATDRPNREGAALQASHFVTLAAAVRPGADPQR